MATDFFTAEVWTWGGLVTDYILFFIFFIRLDTRQVHIAGLTPHPNEPQMIQIAGHVTIADWGVLDPGKYLRKYLIHDRDGKLCPALQRTLDEAGVKRVPLPARSPGRERSGWLLKYYYRKAAA